MNWCVKKLCFFCCLFLFGVGDKAWSQNLAPPLLSSRIYDPLLFNQAYKQAPAYQKKPLGKVLGGIVPHHLLAAPLIAGFFEGLKDQKIETIFLLSPNHYNRGPHNITTATQNWKTLYGPLEANSSLAKELIEKKLAHQADFIFRNEHGIYSLIPFIKKSLPQTRIVPLVIKGKTPSEVLSRLASFIQKNSSKALVLISVDFSHYLPSDQADFFDSQSLKVITQLDFVKASQLHPTNNLDSPKALSVLLQIMHAYPGIKTDILAHTNSAKLTGDLHIPHTTSYFTVYFY